MHRKGLSNLNNSLPCKSWKLTSKARALAQQHLSRHPDSSFKKKIFPPCWSNTSYLFWYSQHSITEKSNLQNSTLQNTKVSILHSKHPGCLCLIINSLICPKTSNPAKLSGFLFGTVNPLGWSVIGKSIFAAKFLLTYAWNSVSTKHCLHLLLPQHSFFLLHMNLSHTCQRLSVSGTT